MIDDDMSDMGQNIFLYYSNAGSRYMYEVFHYTLVIVLIMNLDSKHLGSFLGTGEPMCLFLR